MTDRCPFAQEKNSRRTDEKSDYRTEAERDRDRILYSTAFRRLSAVTQVVGPSEQHLFHNRLTHSLKVAQLARRIAQRLSRKFPEEAREMGGLDPDVAEAAALAHDLGHPPFGHIGEEVLHGLLTHEHSAGGFEGNAQTFRILVRLARRRPTEAGLNLCRATLNGVLKYPWLRDAEDPDRSKKWNAYRSEAETFEWVREHIPTGDARQSPEAAVMDVADDITYALHDLEDFFRVGLIPLDRLASRDTGEFEEFSRTAEQRWRASKTKVPGPADQEKNAKDALELAKQRFFSLLPPRRYSGTATERGTLKTVWSQIISELIESLTLAAPGAASKFVGMPVESSMLLLVLKELTWAYVVRNPSLASQQVGQRRILTELFEILYEEAANQRLDVFPGWIKKEFHASDDTVRTVADFLGGMTELETYRLYARLKGLEPGSILDHAFS